MSRLVRNKEGAKTGIIQALIVNLLPSKLVRHDTLECRDFIVVPMVILTEGVHCGSDGPMFYPKEELAKTPVVWNHKPIVVYHPELNGQSISACDPTVINNRKVGIMMNTRFEKGKLKSEAWIEPTRADAVDTRIMLAINAGEMMELSTGVFVDEDNEPGVWKGEAYNSIARNYRPDHLALLPDQIGACSIKDGAGLLRNAGKEKKSMFIAAMDKVLRDLEMTDAHLVDNELSFSNTREALSLELRKRNKVNLDKGPFLFVEDVYSDFVIYEFNQKLYWLGYTASDTGVTLATDEPVVVIRVTEYRTATGAFVGNANQQHNKENTMNKKKELVDALIGNSNGALVEADRERLMAFSEEQLSKITFAENAKKKAPPEDEEEATPKKKKPAMNNEPVAPVAAPVVVEKPKVVTLADYVASAPSEIQDVLTNGLAMHEEEKGRLIKAITDNKNNSFSEAQLKSKAIGELRSLARLAGGAVTVVPRFDGLGEVPSTNTNAEEPMEMPTLNFGKEPAAAAK